MLYCENQQKRKNITQADDLDFGYVEDWINQFTELLEEPAIIEKYIETRNQVRSIPKRKKK